MYTHYVFFSLLLNLEFFVYCSVPLYFLYRFLYIVAFLLLDFTQFPNAHPGRVSNNANKIKVGGIDGFSMSIQQLLKPSLAWISSFLSWNVDRYKSREPKVQSFIHAIYESICWVHQHKETENNPKVKMKDSFSFFKILIFMSCCGVCV